MEKLLHLLQPILPHTSEEAYQALHNNTSIRLTLTAPFNIELPKHIDKWEPLIQARQQALKLLESHKEKGIENSLDAGLALPSSLQHYESSACRLDDIFGVSRIRFHENESILIDDLRNEPRCERSWKRDPTVKKRENGLTLSDRDMNAIKTIGVPVT